MMRYLTTEFDIPDMVSSPDYIRSRVLALVDRELLVTTPSAETDSESTAEFESESELEPKPESDVEPESKPKSKRDKIPPPPD